MGPYDGLIVRKCKNTPNKVIEFSKLKIFLMEARKCPPQSNRHEEIED
jgi:hypothetical protein